MVPMTSTSRWSSTPHEDRPATTGPGFARRRRRRTGTTAVTVELMSETSGVAGAQGDRLRAPGRRLGVAVVDAARHRARAGGRSDGDRARRARDGRRRARGLPRRHGRPHHGGQRARSPSFTLAELRAMDFSYWWIPGADVTPGPPDGRLPVPGPGAGGPDVRHRHAARGPRAVPRGGAEPRHQADGARGGALRGGAGPPAGRVRPHRRRDRGVVPRLGDRRLPPVRPGGARPRRARWRRPRPGGRCRPARTCPTSRRWPSRCPSARATWSWSTSGSWRRPTAPARRSTSGRSTTRESMERLLDLGVDGIISDVPTTLCGVLRLRGTWPGTVLRPQAVEPGLRLRGLAAAAVRLLAVVGLLLRPELALDRSLRHEAKHPEPECARPSGSLQADAVRMAAAGRRRGVRARDGRLAGRAPARCRGRPGCERRAPSRRRPHGPHGRHEVPHRRGVSLDRPHGGARDPAQALAPGPGGRAARSVVADRGRLARALGRPGRRPARGARSDERCSRQRPVSEARRGRLVLVATPIGNLGDLSPRARRRAGHGRPDLLRGHPPHPGPPVGQRDHGEGAARRPPAVAARAQRGSSPRAGGGRGGRGRDGGRRERRGHSRASRTRAPGWRRSSRRRARR